jgi:hypothetical protein
MIDYIIFQVEKLIDYIGNSLVDLALEFDEDEI